MSESLTSSQDMLVSRFRTPVRLLHFSTRFFENDADLLSRRSQEWESLRRRLLLSSRDFIESRVKLGLTKEQVSSKVGQEGKEERTRLRIPPFELNLPS